jgi:hypothetical protein
VTVIVTVDSMVLPVILIFASPGGSLIAACHAGS